MEHRDIRREALDVMPERDQYRPEPGDGARQAQRAADIERQELEGVPPPADLWGRITGWIRSLFGRR